MRRLIGLSARQAKTPGSPGVFFWADETLDRREQRKISDS
jgi:hypothetical protein